MPVLPVCSKCKRQEGFAFKEDSSLCARCTSKTPKRKPVSNKQ